MPSRIISLECREGMRIITVACVGVLLAACAATPTGAAITRSSGSLTVRVLQPVDGTVTRNAAVKVKGEAPPEAVVTVNDDILVVGSDGRFESDVSLEQGPNVIEIIASDVNGNEVSFELGVTYEP
jgi:hypothetical protein